MPITDAQLLFSDAQAITADAASTNIYDTGSAADQGIGEDLYIEVTVDEVFNNLTSLGFQLQTDDNTGFSSATTLWTKTYLLAALTAGAKILLPCVDAGLERYIRLYYDVTGTAPGTGKISARIVRDRQLNTPTADIL